MMTKTKWDWQYDLFGLALAVGLAFMFWLLLRLVGF